MDDRRLDRQGRRQQAVAPGHQGAQQARDLRADILEAPGVPA